MSTPTGNEFPNPAFPESYKFLSRNPPKRLAHYTNGSALQSICVNKELWAGQPAQMNDSAEQKILFNAMQDHARMCMRFGFPDAEPTTLAFHRMILSTNWKTIATDTVTLFTVSLSEKYDLLSQWRAYCNRSGGYSLSIPSTHLATLANENVWMLGPCMYDFKDVDALVKELYAYHLGVHTAAFKDAGEATNPWMAMVNELRMNLVLYGIFVKHFTFEDEKEWRLVSVPSARRDLNTQLKFVEGQDGLKAFLPFKLATETTQIGEDVCDWAVTIGPNANMEAG